MTLAFSASLDASIPDSSMSHAALCISLFIFYFFQDILDWHRTFGPVFFFYYSIVHTELVHEIPIVLFIPADFNFTNICK